MSVKASQLKALADFFPASDIKSFVMRTTKDKKKGLVAFYADNRAIMDRLDEVCGVGNWQNVFATGPGGGVLCGISINVDGEWITKYDGAENTDFEAVKGGLSSSMRRAAVQWGIARYLYKVPGIWVDLKPQGRTHIPVTTPKMPAKFLPEVGGKKPRAQKVQAPPETPESEDPSKVVNSLTADQQKPFGDLAAKKARSKVAAIYKEFQSGKFGYDKLIEKVTALKDA